MQEEPKDKKTKRIVITSITTLSLLILPYTEITNKFNFIIPVLAEGLVFLILMSWSSLNERKAIKNTNGAQLKIRTSLKEEIRELKEEIDTTQDETVKRTLRKQLLSLYEEKNNEEKKMRDKLRGDVEKYEGQAEAHRSETEAMKDQMLQKASEEIDKIGKEKEM